MFVQNFRFLLLKVMEVSVYPVLTWPASLKYLEVAVLLCQFPEPFGKVRALREVCVKVVPYYPVTFLLAGISVEYLDLDAR